MASDADPVTHEYVIDGVALILFKLEGVESAEWAEVRRLRQSNCVSHGQTVGLRCYYRCIRLTVCEAVEIAHQDGTLMLALVGSQPTSDQMRTFQARCASDMIEVCVDHQNAVA